MEDDSSGCEKDKVRGSTQETEGAVNCVWMESWEATGNDKGLLRWCSGIESTCQCRRCGFDPWVRKVPWRRKWQPTPVFLPGKFHRQGSLVGYWPWGCKESDTTEWLITHTHGHTHTHRGNDKHRRQVQRTIRGNAKKIPLFAEFGNFFKMPFVPLKCLLMIYISYLRVPVSLSVTVESVHTYWLQKWSWLCFQFGLPTWCSW